MPNRPEVEDAEYLAGTGKKGFTGNGGPAKQATLPGPKGIALGPNGDVYLVDTESHTRASDSGRDWHPRRRCWRRKAGDGPDGDPLSCRTACLHGVFVDKAGKVYIGDSESQGADVELGTELRLLMRVSRPRILT